MRPLRRRVPPILQMEAAECGAACLAMVLAYHGCWISLESLRELCGVSRDGTKASNIVKAARRLGLTAKGLRREPAQLAALPTPLIVFWNFNHFIVVESISDAPGAPVHVVDPAVGRRVLTASEFDAGFTGVALAFEPGADFRKQGARASLWRMAADRLRGYAPALALAVTAGILLLVPGLVSAQLTRLFIDDVLSGRHPAWLGPLLGGLVALAGLRGGLMLLQQRVLARAQIAFAATLAMRMLWRVLNLPLGFFAQRYPGDIANRFTMVDRLAGVALGTVVPAALSLISILGYGIAIIRLSPLLSAITLGFAALAVALFAVAARQIEEANRRSVADESKLRATAIQGLSMIEDFRAAGMERRFVARWSGYQARVTEAEQTTLFQSGVLGSAAGAAMVVGGVAVLATGAILVVHGQMGLGTLIAFQMLAAGVTGPLLALVSIGTQIQQMRGLSERLEDIEQAAGPAPQSIRALPAAAREPRPGLVLDNVAFGYAPLDPPFIEGFSLHIPPGRRVALVGGSGSGKTTIGRLMVGLVAPRDGAIALDGTRLPDWDPVELRGAVAYVDQAVGLFQGKVLDNITLWDPAMEEAQAAAAARDAQIHDAIVRRPGAYAAILEEDGRNLSGGERQRLALARAFAVMPRLLVLDEATSALDAPAEQEVMDAVRRRGCACVIIAHRLSAIRDCDEIIVMQAGRIIERGTHEALMQKAGAYWRLIEH